ncbi:protein NO VEIN domain-containing protein, partial [Proteus mirabilis]
VEVKTTNGWERAPFHVTHSELAVAEDRRSDSRLVRLWNFAREPRVLELRLPLEAHVSLTAASYQASLL